MTIKIDYDKITNNARVSILKEIIKHIEENGISGNQQLFITFSLTHPDTIVSKTLQNEFGDEMTIVLQYEFWDLKCDAFGFSVSLAFDHGDETIYIPFAAVSNINDTSEDFFLDLVPDFNARKKIIKQSQPDGSNIISLNSFRKDK